MNKITENIYNIGCDDKTIELFEAQYPVQGMRYNSYLIMDEKIAVLDTMEYSYGEEWLKNIKNILGDKKIDYLVVHHMEPDHSASLRLFLDNYPDTIVVSNLKAFQMMENFFDKNLIKEDKKLIVSENSILDLGKHHLIFKLAPMVHCPEVMMSYEEKEGILFSADAFGKFGIYDDNSPWLDEARRYYIGIVGKYGVQVQNTLKKVTDLKINYLCSLHGEVLKDEKLQLALNYYHLWSSYQIEEHGVLIAYTSIYNHTKKACEKLAKELEKNNVKYEILDLTRIDLSVAVSLAFKYSTLILASTTYNMELFPKMKEFIDHLVERNYQNRNVGIIENGSWAPAVIKNIKLMFEKSKSINYLSEVSIKSSLNETSMEMLNNLIKEIIKIEKGE